MPDILKARPRRNNGVEHIREIDAGRAKVFLCCVRLDKDILYFGMRKGFCKLFFNVAKNVGYHVNNPTIPHATVTLRIANA